MKSHCWIWMLTLLFYCSGCTAYSPVHSPGKLVPDPAQQPSPPSQASPRFIKVGMGIRMTMKSGETLDGRIIDITDDALAFGRPGNYGMKKDYYYFADIEKIEEPHSTSFAKFVTILTVITLVSGVVMFVSLGHGLSGMN